MIGPESHLHFRVYSPTIPKIFLGLILQDLKYKNNPIGLQPGGLTLSHVSAALVFENTVGKGEIAHNEQFLIFSQYFLPVLRAMCHFQQI